MALHHVRTLGWMFCLYRWGTQKPWWDWQSLPPKRPTTEWEVVSLGRGCFWMCLARGEPFFKLWLNTPIGPLMWLSHLPSYKDACVCLEGTGLKSWLAEEFSFLCHLRTKPFPCGRRGQTGLGTFPTFPFRTCNPVLAPWLGIVTLVASHHCLLWVLYQLQSVLKSVLVTILAEKHLSYN